MSLDNKIHKTWEEIYSNNQQLNKVPYSEVLIYLLKQFRGKLEGKKILEIGCGVGNNLFFLSTEFKADVYGIDISETAIKHANEKFAKNNLENYNFQAMDAMELSFEDEAFDAVFDRAALQHNSFNKGKTIMEEVARVLKPNGFFYSTITSQDHYKFFKGEYLGGGVFEDPDHEGLRQFYSNHQVYELFSKDFNITEWRKIEDFNVMENTRTATIHHVGCIKK